MYMKGLQKLKVHEITLILYKSHTKFLTTSLKEFSLSQLAYLLSKLLPFLSQSTKVDHCEVVISSSNEVAEASSSSPLAEEATRETFFKAGIKPPSLDWRHAMCPM